jgi:hypothetical protein
MADDEFDWNADWVPPRKQYMDDIPVIDPEIGKVPLWKSILWNTAKLRNAMARADSDGPTPLTDEQKAPRLAADETPAQATLSDEDLKAMEELIDKLDQRLTALEARRDAEQKLLELEDALEATGIAPDETTSTIKLH